MNKINEKEFNRNVCFTFFESYLEGADKIATVSNKEFAYDYLTGIIRYALYEEESEDLMINAMVAALKNTIDANQNKRASGFSGENTEQTNAILNYYKEHPNATEREVATAVNCSTGKVHKTKKKYLTSNTSYNDTNNITNNSNLNTNGMSVCMSNATSTKTADAEDKNSDP